MDNVRQHEVDLTKYAIEKLSSVKGLHIYGTKDISKRGGVITSYSIHYTKLYDVGTLSNIAKIVKSNKITPPTNIIIGKVVDLSKTIGWK